MKDNLRDQYESTKNYLKGELSGNKKMESKYAKSFIKDIRSRLDAYFRLIVRNIRDSVPKAIGFYLVRSVQNKLVYVGSDLQKPDVLEKLLAEPVHIREERRVLKLQRDIIGRKLAGCSSNCSGILLVGEGSDLKIEFVNTMQLDFHTIGFSDSWIHGFANWLGQRRVFRVVN